MSAIQTVNGDIVPGAATQAELNTKANKRVYKTTSFTADAYGRYQTSGTITISDPAAAVAGDIFEVTVASGTATIGGVAYGVSQLPLIRVYVGSAWTTLSGPATATGLLKSNGAGVVSTAVSGTDYAPGGVRPCFRATLAQTQSTTTAWIAVTLLCDSVTFNVENCYNASTGKFTPTRAGYYSVAAGARFVSADSLTSIYKNGIQVALNRTASSAGWDTLCTALLYFNGSTDYVTATIATGAVPKTPDLSGSTFFQAFFVHE